MEPWVEALRDYAGGARRPRDGTIALAGPSAQIHIVTDRWGVPHVRAATIEDAIFAQGWLHAAERLWQIEFSMRAATGRLSEIVSIAGLGLDKFFRTLGLNRLARTFAAAADDTTRRLAAPYHAGFVAAATSLPKPVEYQFLDLEPHLPAHVDQQIEASFAFVLLMGFTLSANWPFELLRAELAKTLGPERAQELTPFVGAEAPVAVPSSEMFPGVAQALRAIAADAGAVRGLGSNNWVVAGSKSATGKPILCNDPHLLVQMPSVWMEMHLTAPGLNVAGLSLPGTPGIVIGHNDRIAWGFTNTGADVEDLYLERLSGDGLHYEYDGEWRPVTVIEEPIVVRGEAEPLIHPVRETHHGPLLTGWIATGATPVVLEDFITDPLALRWILRDTPPSTAGIMALNVASNFDEFRAAVAQWPTAGQNMVYADVDGAVGYQFTGRVPIRGKGSGASPLPGWDSAYEWTGVIPFDELPATLNPQRGFVATANHRLVDLDYPHYLTNDWELPHRIRRITALLTETEVLSVEDMKRIQNDTYSGVAAELAPLLLCADIAGDREARAASSIQSWDLMLDAESTAAAIFAVWFANAAELIFAPRLGPAMFDEFYARKGWVTNWCYEAMRDVLTNPQQFWIGGDGDNMAARDALLGRALTAAVDDLTARFGDDMGQWQWGRMHQVHFAHVLAQPIPDLHELLSAGPFPAGGGDDTINRGVIYPSDGYAGGAVPSARLIIDLGDFDRSECVITTGVSGNPADPHYRDQALLWARGEYHPMPFTEAAVDAAAEARLTIRPA